MRALRLNTLTNEELLRAVDAEVNLSNLELELAERLRSALEEVDAVLDGRAAEESWRVNSIVALEKEIKDLYDRLAASE